MQDTTSLLTSQIAAAAACAYLVTLLQKWSRTPWITEHTAGINIAVRVLLSVAATVGIGFAWSGSAGDGHTLTITIPPAIQLIHGLWHVFSQYCLTHLTGKALEQPKAVLQAPAPPAVAGAAANGA